MEDRRPDLIIMGAPGSGKTTQAARVAERLGAVHVNPGTLFRQLAAEHSSVGDRIRELMSQGRLVPDDVTDKVVAEAVAAVPNDRRLVLEGYPRNPGQAAALRRLLGEMGRLEPRPVVVQLDVSRDELIRRLRGRSAHAGRSDDTDEVIARRLNLHDAQSAEVMDAVAGWTDVVRVNGEQDVEDVTDDIVAGLPT